MEAVGLRTHIWNNNLRSAFLLAGFPVLLLVIIYALLIAAMIAGLIPSGGGPGGDAGVAGGMMLAAAPLSILVAVIWFVIAWFSNTAIIAAATGARSVSRTEQPQLYNLVENLALSRGLRMPRLNIIDTPALNAFASGVSASQYTITVTSGLMETLDKDEMEAVLGHEMTHIINRDVRTMMVAAVFVGIFTLASQLIFQSLRFSSFRSSRRDRSGGIFVFLLIAMAILALGRLLAVVVRMTLSRSREFVADAGSVELTKNPDAMISALRKIEGHSQLNAPDEVRAMFIDNEGGGVMGLFATHPPIAARIAALVKYAGGREAPPVMTNVTPAAAATPAAPKKKPWGYGGPWG